jgi:hypothetical protein
VLGNCNKKQYNLLYLNFYQCPSKTLLFCIGAFGQKSTKTDTPYGIHPMFRATAKVVEPVHLPVTPLTNRVINAESMVLAFTAENSLSFTLVPRLIELAKAVAVDKKISGFSVYA